MSSRKRLFREGDKERPVKGRYVEHGYQPIVGHDDQPGQKTGNPTPQTGNQPSASKGGSPANSPIPPKEE